jgi:hypothetical protein
MTKSLADFCDIIPPRCKSTTSCLGRAISVLEWVFIPTKLILFHASLELRVGERIKLGEINGSHFYESPA